jgi:hypothetical protein
MLTTPFSVSYATKNVLHGTMAGRTRTATINGAGLRYGTFSMIFKTEAAKTAAVALLNGATTFQVSSDEISSVEMNASTGTAMVITGDVQESLDPDTQYVWVVTFPWEELA